MAKATDAEIAEYVDQNWEAYLADAERLIAIDSSEDLPNAAPGAPFGPGPRKALDEMLAIAERFGLETHDGEGYAGFADLPGESGQQVGVIGHVDVVPAGEGWHFEPFALTRKDGMLLGRGTTDDKMPVLGALYALKFWMERGVSLRHTIRFIFGCNEESGMAEIPYYLKHYGAPDFLFTPDADFPLCYGEKGLFGCTISKNVPEGAIVSFSGGTASNAVPGVARAVVTAAAATLPAADRIAIEPAGEGLALITATGVSGHASLPEGTVNAVAVLARYLMVVGVCSAEENAWLEFVANLASNTDGSAVGAEAADDDFGALTSVVGVVSKEGERWSFTVDIRFPTATTSEKLEKIFREAAANNGAEAEVTRAQDPFVVNPDTAPVQALLDGYCEETGKNVRPFTMGGATYAREFPNAVSFGPAEPGAFDTPSWVGGMHGADEGVAEEEVKRAMRIYIRAFGNLAEVENVSA